MAHAGSRSAPAAGTIYAQRRAAASGDLAWRPPGPLSGHPAASMKAGERARASRTGKRRALLAKVMGPPAAGLGDLLNAVLIVARLAKRRRTACQAIRRPSGGGRPDASGGFVFGAVVTRLLTGAGRIVLREGNAGAAANSPGQ
jgi:hypothetical protein